MRIAFTIPGQIIGKGRPKFTTIGGFGRAYTPAKTRNAEAMVRHFGAEAMKGLPLFEGPLRLSIVIYKQHPSSWSKKRKAETFFVTGKPDCTNAQKMVEDGFNGVVWKDDSQLAVTTFARYYSTGPERAEIEITDELVLPDHIVDANKVIEPPATLPLFRPMRRRRTAP